MNLTSRNIAQVYYYITPVFFLIDAVGGQTFRIAGLDDATYRNYYYLFCMLCGLACYLAPRYSELIIICESSINMLILLLGVMFPIFTAGVQVDNNVDFIGLSGQRLINFLLAGSLVSYYFYSAQFSIRDRDI